MKLKEKIEAAWDDRSLLKETDIQEAINDVVDQLDRHLCNVLQIYCPPET